MRSTAANVTLTDTATAVTTIGRVLDAASCPTDQPAWYYDNPAAPTTIHLLPDGMHSGHGCRSGLKRQCRSGL
jgi:hypothetical protein